MRIRDNTANTSAKAKRVREKERFIDTPSILKNRVNGSARWVRPDSGHATIKLYHTGPGKSIRDSRLHTVCGERARFIRVVDTGNRTYFSPHKTFEVPVVVVESVSGFIAGIVRLKVDETVVTIPQDAGGGWLNAQYRKREKEEQPKDDTIERGYRVLLEIIVKSVFGMMDGRIESVERIVRDG
jgi:hypothetical protein